MYICRREKGAQCLVFLCLMSQQDSCLNDLVGYMACGEGNKAGEKGKDLTWPGLNAELLNFPKAQKD